ncbi:hypothetical protein [Actinomadura sp. 6N118]|uniref:hypothetical protein n=1 Tax=Actinomadura sp. 6N118 TaxID=3375151 RepID=UPI0037BD5B80
MSDPQEGTMRLFRLRRRPYKKEHAVILIIGYTMTFIPLLIAGLQYIKIDQPYRVEYGDSGNSCSSVNDTLTIDRQSGGQLACGGTSSAVAPGPWEKHEVDQITDLAHSLASDGLSDVDEQAIKKKSEQIGATHGYPKREIPVDELGGILSLPLLGIVLIMFGPRLEEKSRASIKKNQAERREGPFQ